MTKPLLLLPESGGAWIKACYDAQNDAMLTDDISLQKARSKFIQAYEGNMIVRGERGRCLVSTFMANAGARILRRYHEEAQRYLLPLFKFNQS